MRVRPHLVAGYAHGNTTTIDDILLLFGARRSLSASFDGVLVLPDLIDDFFSFFSENDAMLVCVV